MKMGTDHNFPFHRSTVSRLGKLWSVPIFMCALAAAPIAVAQQMYKWKDEKGVWHFSENPPPDGSKADKIEVKPVGGERPAVPPPDSWRNKELESKQQKAKAEGADAIAKKREEERRAEKCRAYKAELDNLTGGVRLFHLNDKGERVFMEDKERHERIEDAKKAIRENC